MRSGWPHAQEEPGSLASQRQAQYGPADSWPDGYPVLGHPDGDYRYPQHGMDPYAVDSPAPARPPAGEHPYAAFRGGGQPSGGYTTPDIEAFGYGDPGYSDPGYDGPASQDTGIAGTQTVRGFVESSHRHAGGYGSAELDPAYGGQGSQSPDIYHQPWDYQQPLRYDDEDPAYPMLDSHGQAAHSPAAYDPADYNGSEFSVPGITGTGYDLSGIIGTGEFPHIGYDQPGYDRLSYDDPRYADATSYGEADGPAYGEADSAAYGELRHSTRFDMPAIDSAPRDSDTRFDLPALDAPALDAPAGYRRHDNTRFDMPVIDDSSRLDHVWPAREDLPAGSLDSLNQTSLDFGAAQFEATQTRFDMPAVEDYQYGDRFMETSADGMRALAPETEFRPAGAGLVAPVGEEPMSWADETSFDRFGDLSEIDGLDEQDYSAAFVPGAEPSRAGSRASSRAGSRASSRERENAARRAAGGKRRGRSGDKRQWMALGAIGVAAAGAIAFVMMKTVFSGPSGPTHSVSTPDKVAGFTRQPNLEQQMKVDQLRDSIVRNGGGKISDAVSAVYQEGSSAIGSNPQTYMFVGGKLADSDPVASLGDFEQKNKGAHTVSSGSLGGEAACGTATVNGESVSICVWFDNDTFGEFASPTMTPNKLASTMDQARPTLEHMAH